MRLDYQAPDTFLYNFYQVYFIFNFSYKVDPVYFTLGEGALIDGLEKGILGTCLKEQREITIPPQMAFNDIEMEGIPPGEFLTVLFILKLYDLYLFFKNRFC